MDNRLIFLYRSIGAMEGRSMLGDPSEWRFPLRWDERRAKVAGRSVGKSAGHQSEDRKDHKPSGKWDSLILGCREKLLCVEDRAPVPQTDTGRRGEKPKVREINHVKELGKLTP